MKQKPAFFLAAVLSVFILTALGGAVSVLAENGPTGADTQNEAQVAPEVEAAYSQVIAEANQRLLEAQAVIDSLQNGGAVSANVAVDLSAEEAAQIASAVAIGNNEPSNLPELVDFEGNVAYEIAFAAGNIYVDAMSGEVIFNGTLNVVVPDISAERAVQIATSYMGNNEIYKVEPVTLNGELVYRVKFLNSDAVFVSLKGEILLVRLAPTITASSSGSSSQSQGEHEQNEHEEHEFEDDD